MTKSTCEPSHVREPTPDTINDSLLCLQTVNLNVYLLRCFFYQQMNQMQRLRAKHQAEVRESCRKVGDGIKRFGGGQGYRKVNKPWLMRLTGIKLPNKEHVGAGPSEPRGLLQICSRYATWFFCGSINKWNRTCL